MLDNDQITDAEIVQQVAEKDAKLAEVVQARLRVLRLGRVVTPTPPPPRTEPQAVPH